MNETVNVSKGKRILSLALSISLVLSNLPCSAFATELDGLCSHHRSHTEDCGYSEASSGSPCTHEHTLDCYEIVECVHECDEDCEEYGCTHVCSEESGCVTRKWDCHHTHDDTCGYSEGTPASPCHHVHDENCGYVEAVEEVLCDCTEVDEDGNLIHEDGCGYVAPVEGAPCRHVHDETCGYAEATEGTPCQHVCGVIVDSEDSCYALLCSHAEEGQHDDTCGYVAPDPGSPCQYDCPACKENAKPPEQTESTETTVATEETNPTEATEETQPEQTDEAVEAVRAMIAALPNVSELEAMDSDAQNAAYQAVQDAWDAYEALTEDQQDQLIGERETLDALMATINAMVDKTGYVVRGTPYLHETSFYAYGTDLYIVKAGSGTAVYYLDGTTKKYLNTNGASGDNLSGYNVYAGANYKKNDSDVSGDVTIRMTGGSIGSMYCSGFAYNTSGTVNIIVTGGTVKSISKNASSNLTSSGVSKGKSYVYCAVAPTDQYQKGANYTGGLVKNSTGWTMIGNPVLHSEVTWTLNSSDSMEWPAGSTLTNNGKIVNNGAKITGGGTFVNNGTITCTQHSYGFQVKESGTGDGTHVSSCFFHSDTYSTTGEACTFNSDGICTVCSGYQPAVWNSSNNCYEISNYGQLLWYGAYGSDKNGFLLNDLKIGQSSSYYTDWPGVNVGGSSTFDGNHHTIEMYLTYSNIGGTATRGVVGLFTAASGATIQNLTLKGDIKCNISGPGNDNNPARVGAISGSGYGLKLNSILSYVNITNTGTGPTGGLVGYFGGGGATINNCAVYADVQGGSQVGGLVGAGWNGNQSWTIKNSAFYGTLQGGENKVGAMMGYSETDGGASSSYVTNCYYSEGYTSLGGQDKAIKSDTGITKTTAQFSSGEVCWLLNNKNNSGTGVWKQTIGSAYPTFTGTDVYAVEGAVASIYTNDSDIIQKNASGYYEIYSKKHLLQFGEFVNLGNKDANGILMADIDLSGTTWTPICTTGLYYDEKYTEGYDDENTGYAGIFDGNCHVIKNLSVSGNSGKQETYGLFGTLSQTGTIKNLGIEKFTFNLNGAKDIRTGAIVGQILGGTVSNCYVCSATITPNNYVVGGIAGCNYAGTIENCHAYDCTLSGTTNRFGWIVGDNRADGGTTDRPGTLRNCYTNGMKILGERTGTQENCEANASAKFQSGEVTWLLNGQTDTGIWKQTLSAQAYPTFSGEIVYHSGSEYFNSNTPSQSGGYYLISNAAELLAFAKIVNSGNKTAKGKLTADIDMSGISWETICSTGLYYSNTYASGNYSDAGFAGIFDGDYHVIKNLCVTSVAGVDGTYGLFGTLSGTVKNLGIEGFTYIHNKPKDMRAGGIAGQVLGGTIQSCYVTNATINPNTCVVGGIAASNYAGRIENCHVYNSKIQGTASGSTIRYGWIVADNRADTAGDRVGTVVNCYTDGSRVVGAYSGTETDCQANVGPKFTSGEVTYLLNGKTSSGVWKQTIGTDKYPKFVGKAVYKVIAGYTNSDIPKTDNSGRYLIYNVAQMLGFAELVNGGSTGITGLMMNDIDMTGVSEFRIGTSSNKFRGTFDGQGHTLTVALSGAECVAPFSYVNGATIQKLVVEGTIAASGKFAAGIVGESDAAGKLTLAQCMSTVTITSTVDGDGTHGGLVGVSDGTLSIANCGFTGSIRGEKTHSCGGLVGWINKTTTISNSYVAGTFTLNTTDTKDSSKTFARKNNASLTTTNCYYLNLLKEVQGTQKAETAFQSGEVTYLLNGKTSDGVWKQTIDTKTAGTDSSGTSLYPVFNGMPVYQMRERYVNYAPPTTNSDGWFDIKTAENLMAFAQYVNLGTYTANAVVTSDISLANYTGKWVPIARTTMGNDVSTGFTGTFDGQGHTIHDISFGKTTEKCTNGLFGTIYKGGVVKHIGVTKLSFDDNTYDHRAGGIAGQLMYGGRIENCFVTDSTIKASSRVVGGIAAMNLGTIENCYTKGLTLSAHTNRFGGICGDYKGNSYSNNENGKVINCYTDYATLGSTASDNMGTATDSEAGVPLARFQSGEITYLLNQKSSENPIWYQKLGSENYPAFTGSTVYYGYRDCLSEGAEYANTELNPDQSHSYTLAPEFRWSEDDKTCTAIFTCALDSSHDTCEVPCEMSFDTSNSDETICTASVTMNGKTYSDSKIHQNTIISVNVSWSEMEFDYTDGEWNAETHEYAVGTWTPKTENGDTLTISNAGNVKLDVAVSYEQAENSGIEGTVRVESSETNAFTLELEEEKRIHLSLSGKPAEHIQHELLGTIVLRLKRVDTDSQNVPDVSGTE